jgi:ABC transporter related protein
MKKWKSSITQILENWKIIIRFFLKYNDKMVIILFLVVILGSLTGLGISYLLSYYINTVIANSSGIHKTVLVISFVLIGVYVVDLMIGVINSAIRRRVMARSSKKIQEEAIDFSASDDYLHFVSKDQKDKQSYVANISGNGNSTILNGILSFVRGISTIIGSMVLLFPVSGWWIIPMVLLLTVTCLVVENNNRRKFRELFGNTIRDNRRMSYYFGLLTGSASSYELTLFGLSKPFHERMESLNKEIVGQKKKTSWKVSVNTMAFRVVYSMVYIGFILLILLGGKIQDAGTIFLVFSITRSVISCATGIGSSVSSVYMEAEYIYGYMDYLKAGSTERANSRKELLGESPVPKEDEVIRVEHLNFRYYDNEEVLKDISFTVHKNEKVAIVGENGAGKTTLVNVLLGLFDGNGSVCVNGVDPYLDLNRQTEQSNIVSVMQNFGRYRGISLGNNISFGKPLNGQIREKLKPILDMNDQEIDRALNETMGNEFGGVGISGGQWQKIALLRGEMNHKIVVLDEPTASMDPLSEVKVLQDFMKEDSDNTKLIITHRLGCTRYADKIIVLDKGSVVEEGTYEELLALKGKYYEMYTAQAELYQV